MSGDTMDFYQARLELLTENNELRAEIARLREELAAANETAAKWEHACDCQRERAEQAEQREREALVFPTATTADITCGWTYSCDYILRLKDKAEDIEPGISMEQIEAVLSAIDAVRKNPIPSRAREQANKQEAPRG